MTRERKLPLCWLSIDAAARNGRAQLVKRGGMMAVARWDGQYWIYPGSSGHLLDFEPEEYYLSNAEMRGVRI